MVDLIKSTLLSNDELVAYRYCPRDNNEFFVYEKLSGDLEELSLKDFRHKKKVIRDRRLTK